MVTSGPGASHQQNASTADDRRQPSTKAPKLRVGLGCREREYPRSGSAGLGSNERQPAVPFSERVHPVQGCCPAHPRQSKRAGFHPPLAPTLGLNREKQGVFFPVERRKGPSNGCPITEWIYSPRARRSTTINAMLARSSVYRSAIPANGRWVILSSS